MSDNKEVREEFSAELEKICDVKFPWVKFITAFVAFLFVMYLMLPS